MKSTVLAIALVLCFSLSANAELYDVGSGVLYDSTYDITWLGDAGASGLGHFAEISLWVEETQHLNFNGWRLPTIDELIHMHRDYYVGEERAIIGFAGYTFWSSSAVAGSDEDVWATSFTDTWNEGESPIVYASNMESGLGYGWAVADGNLVGAPVANAGADRVVYDNVILDGSLSTDSDGEIESYNWQLIHRENSAYNLTVEGKTPTVSNLKKGFYDVYLTVIDNHGGIGTDQMLLAAVGKERIVVVVPLF